MSKNHVFVIYVVRFCSNIDATVMTDCTILYDTIGYANLQIFNKQSKNRRVVSLVYRMIV